MKSDYTGDLCKGEVVWVNQVKGRRARVISRGPHGDTVRGWVSLRSSHGIQLLVQLYHYDDPQQDKSNTTDQDKEKKQEEWQKESDEIARRWQTDPAKGWSKESWSNDSEKHPESRSTPNYSVPGFMDSEQWPTRPAGSESELCSYRLEDDRTYLLVDQPWQVGSEDDGRDAMREPRLRWRVDAEALGGWACAESDGEEMDLQQLEELQAEAQERDYQIERIKKLEDMKKMKHHYESLMAEKIASMEKQLIQEIWAGDRKPEAALNHLRSELIDLNRGERSDQSRSKESKKELVKESTRPAASKADLDYLCQDYSAYRHVE